MEHKFIAVVIVIICIAAVTILAIGSTIKETEKTITIKDRLLGYKRIDEYFNTRYKLIFENRNIELMKMDTDYLDLFIGENVIFTYREKTSSSILTGPTIYRYYKFMQIDNSK